MMMLLNGLWVAFVMMYEVFCYYRLGRCAPSGPPSQDIPARDHRIARRFMVTMTLTMLFGEPCRSRR